MAATFGRSGMGPLELLVIQPTPFCNLDCTYCYLPNRQSKAKMSLPVLERVFERVFSSNLVNPGGFTVVWHAGEPLVLPTRFYEQAFEALRRHNVEGVRIDHSFQTNGTVLDQGWCEFIKEHGLRVGVSVDGPAYLHDATRKTRRGEGTLRRVEAGMALLRDNGIPFHVITVLTATALDYPDELFDFYAAHGVKRVGFNVEEVEGSHRESSLGGSEIAVRYARFLSRFFDLAAEADPPLVVREYSSAMDALRSGGRGGPAWSQETTPFAITSVDWEGNFSTYSPELLGLPDERYGGFMLGNVETDTFESAVGTDRFRAISADIASGIDQCRRTCSYFSFCGGGAPANKYFENGTFASSETMFCRLSKKAVLDVVLGKLERA